RQNAQFLVFLAAFIKGVDEYQDYLRCSVVSAGNDHRLGAGEAPPAIISIFLGDELTSVVESIINGTNYVDPKKSLMRIGVDVLPAIPKDTTDRNRTSPLAFTGNKFEFRMLGSSQSISGPNVALNTIMAEELGHFADILEKAEDFDAALQHLVSKTFTEHQRIIFNGNGYAKDWEDEAARRGLSNLNSTPKSLATYLDQKFIDLVTKHGIYTEAEYRARHEIHLESYCKLINIEARTSIDMVLHQILPAAIAYTKSLCDAILAKKQLGLPSGAESSLAEKLSSTADSCYAKCEQLRQALDNIPSDSTDASVFYHDTVVSLMESLRKDADVLEQLTDKTYWPYPTYSDLLYY
ncbi:MAG: glutamine synthetase type III, partial [Oscillospiraceae bacterium]|nr:glutamine synthetase type III [Oscillospiraceae bacterium]